MSPGETHHLIATPMIPPITLFKALSDETRLRAVLLIQQERELCVCELVAALEESQPKVSRHLAQLKSTGLLTDRRQQQWVYYQLNPELPEWATAIISDTREHNQSFIKEAASRLREMGDRPIRASALCQ